MKYTVKMLMGEIENINNLLHSIKNVSYTYELDFTYGGCRLYKTANGTTAVYYISDQMSYKVMGEALTAIKRVLRDLSACGEVEK